SYRGYAQAPLSFGDCSEGQTSSSESGGLPTEPQSAGCCRPAGTPARPGTDSRCHRDCGMPPDFVLQRHPQPSVPYWDFSSRMRSAAATAGFGATGQPGDWMPEPRSEEHTSEL